MVGFNSDQGDIVPMTMPDNSSLQLSEPDEQESEDDEEQESEKKESPVNNKKQTTRDIARQVVDTQSFAFVKDQLKDTTTFAFPKAEDTRPKWKREEFWQPVKQMLINNK